MLATSSRCWSRAAVATAVLLALLAPLSCAPDLFTPDPPATPPPPPPPPPAPSCNPVVQALRLERYGAPSALIQGREIAVLGADIGVIAIAQLSCAGGSLPLPNWSVDNLGVLQLTTALPANPGQAIGGFTAMSPGQAVVTLEFGGRQSSMAIEVPSSPAVGRLQLVSAGTEGTCGLNEASQVFCWGINRYLLVSNLESTATGLCLTLNGIPCRPTPLQRQLPVTLEGVDLGSERACGIAAGVAWCWGQTLSGPAVPFAVSGTANLRSVSAGGSHSCGLNDQGAAFCWGYNQFGQLGNNSTVSSAAAVAVGGDRRYAAIAAGLGTTCALTAEGGLYCWGDGLFGTDGFELCGGSGKYAPTPCWKVPTRVVPVLAGADSVFRSLSLGSHACAISSGGRVYCWNGQPFILGVKSDSTRVALPTPVETDLLFESVSVGYRRTCGLVAGGAAWCWGPAPSVPAPRSAPEPVPGGHHFLSITTGDGHVCGIALNGKAYCWGANYTGQLGTGNRSLSLVPLLIRGQPE